MKFHTLHIENFGTIKEVDLSLSSKGLTLIFGKNEDTLKSDSNGAGKSLLLDAFVWCVWGKTIRGLKGDSVVHEKVGKNCCVSVTLEEEGSTYVITRYQKHQKSKKPNDVELLLNGQDVSQSSLADTQNYIDQIIGVDFTTFCATMPGSMIKPAELTDTKIKELLEQILQTETFSKAQSLAKEYKRDKEATLTESKAFEESAESRISDIDLKLKSLQDKSDNFTYNKQQKLSELESKKESIQNEVHYLTETLKAKESYPNLSSIKSNLDKIKLKLDEVEQRIEGEDSEYLKFKEEMLTTVSRKDEAIRATKEVIERLENLEGTCYVCNQLIDESHRKSELDRLHKQLYSLEDEKNELLTHKEQVKKLYDDKIDSLKSAKSEHKTDKHKIVHHMEEAKEAQNEQQRIQDKISYKEKELNTIKTSIKEQQDQQNPYIEMLEELTSEKEQINNDLEKTKKAIKTLQKEISNYDFWIDGFSQTGLRSYMLDHVTPILNNLASHYSEILTEGEMEITFHTKTKQKSGKWKEEFNIKVSQAHGGSSYISNSTGERNKANLVIALVLGDLASMRARKTIPFRFLDEPFAHIDETGIDAILSLLNDQNEKYDSVFVISHRTELKEHFNNSLLMRKLNCFSTLEEINE